jgi:hypothetical protein
MTARVFVFPRFSIDLLIGTLIHVTDARPNPYLWLWRFHGVPQQSLTLGYDNGAIYKSHFFCTKVPQALIHAVASGSAGGETWRLWATSFDSSKLSLRSFHTRWVECSQQGSALQSTNHPTWINCYSIWRITYLSRPIVSGSCAFSGILGFKV